MLIDKMNYQIKVNVPLEYSADDDDDFKKKKSVYISVVLCQRFYLYASGYSEKYVEKWLLILKKKKCIAKYHLNVSLLYKFSQVLCSKL